MTDHNTISAALPCPCCDGGEIETIHDCYDRASGSHAAVITRQCCPVCRGEGVRACDFCGEPACLERCGEACCAKCAREE